MDPPFFLHLRLFCNCKSNVPDTLLDLPADALQPLPVPFSSNFPGTFSDTEIPFTSTDNRQRLDINVRIKLGFLRIIASGTKY